MPSDQTPRQPGAAPSQGPAQAGHQSDLSQADVSQADFSQALAGESGDPIWESHPAHAEAGRADRPRRAAREPEGKLRPGRLIDLVQRRGN